MYIQSVKPFIVGKSQITGSFVNATFKVTCPQIKMVNKLMLCMQLIFIDLFCSFKKATLPGGSRDYHVVIVLFSSHVYSSVMFHLSFVVSVTVKEEMMVLSLQE